MIESDQSDKEVQDQVSSLNVSNNSMSKESVQKRLREESPEDEELQLPSKKFCATTDKTEENDTKGGLNVNGTVEDTNKDDKSTNASNDNQTNKKLEETTSCNRNENESIISGGATEKGDKSGHNRTNRKRKEISTELTTTVGTKETRTSEEEEEEEEEEEKEAIANKKKTLHVEDAEVVEGLELSVECASDKESSSSSEKEDDTDQKPKPKTIIIKAKPNDSELDVSPSESEASSTKETSKTKAKQSTRKGRNKRQTSSSQITNTDSEDDNDISDKNNSPPAKRKQKKTINKKGTKPPAAVEKSSKVEKDGKSIEKDDEKDENLVTTENKRADENSSNAGSSQSKSESESDTENVSKDGEGDKRREKTKHEDDKKIQVLKKYIRLTGIRVKSYNDLWAGCKTNAARVRRLKSLLEENGVSGRPTLEKCKKAKEERERLQDIAELNAGNIISEGRVTRAQRHKDSSNKGTTKTPETPTKHREARRTYKRVLRVIDSDSE